jgi:hypothetical protein
MPQPAPVPLDAFLSDLEPRTIKKGVSAPLGYHVDALLKVVHDQVHEFWPISPADLVEAIIFDAKPDAEELRRIILSYKSAHVWEVRTRLGEQTPQAGTWKVPIRAQGERSG